MADTPLTDAVGMDNFKRAAEALKKMKPLPPKGRDERARVDQVKDRQDQLAGNTRRNA